MVLTFFHSSKDPYRFSIEQSMSASPTKLNGTDSELRKAADALELNGHASRDAGKTEAADASAASTPDAVTDKQRLEQKRLEREEQRARLEAQMKQLEADQRADDLLLHGGASVNIEAASAPTSPLGAADRAPGSGTPAPIGQGREVNGAKSMPASRRTSGYGGTFGMEKLSLSSLDKDHQKDWQNEDDVDAEGAQKSVSYLINDDDPFPGLPKDKHLSAASAALDLAPLPQASTRAFGSRPFDNSLKSSDWSTFPNSARGLTSPLGSNALMGAGAGDETPRDPLLGSRKTSPNGLADSIASLPAMPSKSVPATPFGLGPSAAGMAPKRTGTSPGLSDGFTQAQRGFSNPDLARAFSSKSGGNSGNAGNGGFGSGLNDTPRPYGSDPLYSSMGMPNSSNAFMQQGYNDYGFEDDNFGSGALYPAGMMGLKTKRAEADREFNRFSGMRLEDLQGEILSLCKDQHGCRYLQKKLEEGDPAHRDMIFRETYGHFPELMIDPFGNYLCQKLLEHATEEQRSAIIVSVSNDLVGISLNMHGTRAVQKMVDFLAQPRQPKQIRTLIYALSVNVVALIKDLNGNHVIQKCLNKLIPEDNQFIYNAIATNLIEVATHRHGCCVLQRSIDHASPAQRLQLVTEIIFNSLYLVQDPFGNYVIQYILDLNDARFSEPLIRTFIGNVCSLSVQKFSSNVVEKCIRVADPEIRKVLVAEVLNRSRLEKLLRDSYGNYVIQTILDYCEIGQRMVLVECIRPILPSIRNTPYGKRIQSKLQREDASFSYGGGGAGAGGGYGGGRGGYGGNRAGGGGYHPRHLGRPQLQHINALTEVYGAAGAPFMGPGGYGRGGGPGQHGGHGPHGGAAGGGAPFHGREIHNHSGMSYHAPGPDGQPWLHLRGPAGQPAPNWNTPPSGSNHAGIDPLPATAPSDADPALAAAAAAAAVTDRNGQGQPGLPLWQDPSGGYMYATTNGGHLPPLM